MITALLGKKLGMSQYIYDDGRMVPVTVIEMGPCTITQLRTQEKDGYEKVQLGFQTVKKANSPKKGHLKNTGLFRYLREVPADTLEGLEVGQQIGPDLFESGEYVTLVGTSKGRGFQGTVKRHGFHGGSRTHGQSDRLRAPGSIGMGTTPGRVFKGKKMSGHMGNVRVTVKNLEVVDVDQERNLLMVKGGVPGAPQGLVIVHKAKKGAKSQ
ncbi:MAG: 50S ribosomal protein L3 [Dehalococcoidia bacterium]